MKREAAEKLEAAAAEARREKEKLANEEKQERVRIAAEARDEAAKAAAEAKLLDDRMALELRTATQVTIVCVGGGGRPAMEGLRSAMSSVHFDIRNGASVAAVIEGVGLPGVELKETDVAAALGAYASAKHRRTLLSCSPFAARPEEFGGTSRLSAYSPNMTYSVGGVRWRHGRPTGQAPSSTRIASARWVRPSARALVVSFSVVRATSRNLFAADVAHMAALLADVVMAGTLATTTDRAVAGMASANDRLRPVGTSTMPGHGAFRCGWR